MNDTRRFLERLAGAKDDAALLVLFTLPDLRTRWFMDLDRAAAEAVKMAQTQNVYVGIGLHDRALGGRARGTEQDVSALTALVADIDVTHDVHQHANLPPTLDDARALLGELPLDPSMVLDSGHGLQALWTFNEPYVYDDDADRERATSIAAGWSERIKAAAAAHDWHVDSVFDPSRVMRIPGTWNRKDETDVRPVTLLSWDGPTYGGPDDFADHVTPLTRAQRGKAPSGGGAPTFTLNPDAEAPSVKLRELLRDNAKFRGAFDRSRSDVEDKSQSGWDFAMAWQTLPAGWSHQETVDLLVAHRREGPSERSALDKKVGYYQTTINNVTWGVAKGWSEKKARAAIDTDAVIALGPDEVRASLLHVTGIAFTEVIERFPKQDKAFYHLRIGEGEPIPIGDADAIRDQKRVASVLWQKAHRTLPKLKVDVWEDVVGLLLGIITTDDVPGATRTETLAVWVDRYLDEHPPVTDDDTERLRAARFEHTPYREGGRLYLQAEELAAFARGHVGEPLTANGVIVYLRDAGWEPVRIQGRHPATGEKYLRRYWIAPEEAES